MNAARQLISAALLSMMAARVAPQILFTPSLSENCRNTLSTLSTQLEPADCGPITSGVLTDTNEFSTCTRGVNGVDCFNPGAVSNVGWSSSELVPVYRLPASSQCDLCTPSSGMLAQCLPLLQQLSAAVYGDPLNFTAVGLTDPADQAAATATAQQAAIDCIQWQDKASVQILEFQSQVLCDSTNTFGLTVDNETNTIPGVLDMRSLMQCGTCAVLPCLPGQLCNGDGQAKICPEGSYCPAPMVALPCPKGSYCPEGSTEPRSCRGIAAASCQDESNARQVAWLPMFFATLLLAALYGLEVMADSRGQVSHRQKEYAFEPVATAESRDDRQPGYAVHTEPVSISFQDLDLVTGTTQRLSKVSGRILPGRFTAILGGSGAGKTSLMNVILGREAKTAGQVSFLDGRGERVPTRLLDRVVAFVPQNDVYLREMTVLELVRHSARWRTATTLSAEAVERRVQEVLEALHLTHLKDVPVGGLGSLGSSLSPGDRKKVNIALELVADPAVIFLDEPTTSIDASSALKVARIISQLAHAGLTCVAVIHQPRAEIFHLIDDMIILVRGGRLAYQGPTEWVLDYFASLGCVLADLKANKTDFLIDLTSKPPPTETLLALTSASPASLARPASSPSPSSSAASLPTDPRKVGDSSAVSARTLGAAEAQACIETATTVSAASVHVWADIWEREGMLFLQRMQAQAKDAQAVATTCPSPVSLDAVGGPPPADCVPLDTPRISFWKQWWLNAQRGVTQHVKHRAYLSDLCIHFVAGVIMGIVTSGGPLFVNAPPITYTGSCPPGAEIRCNSWVRFQIGPATFLMTMILGAVTVPYAVKAFGREKEVFAREAAVGADKRAYFLGKVLADWPFLALNVFMYMAPMMAIAPWQGPSHRMYGVLVCIALCVCAMGYWLSMLFSDPDAAVLTGVILSILLNLFGGFVPTIGDGVIGWLMYTHWAARGICVTELWYGQGLDNVADYNNVVPMNWKNPDYTLDCLYMLAITLVLYLCTFVSILYSHRRVAKHD